ncbi:ASKHA domain-containing protein [Desulfolucanica intricata]|uniref:ASKHA domain-containing protein n=1 Tax=Desulfolucanica intricata TaxID=1285191 RepID=UPI0009EDCC22|nr:ASKHA domain-containing protein [Desulfolucanica intricata]
MSNNYVTVTFLPSGTKRDVLLGTTLMTAAGEAGLEINALCGGKGSCGKCSGRILEGSVSDITDTELEHFTFEEIKQGLVLLCQRRILGNVVVETLSSTTAQYNYTPCKGELMNPASKDVPPVSKKHHRLSRPTINDNAADLDRLLAQLPGEVKVNVSLLSRVPTLLREAGYDVTSVVFNDRLLALEKGDTVSDLYGIALDIGTTTVAGYLVNMAESKTVAAASTANRQRIYGADVISRITYILENSGGLTKMKELTAQTIDEVVFKLLEESGVSPERVYILSLIGNTVMSHFLLGVSPKGIATSPFVPAFTRSVEGCVKELGLKSLPDYARFILLPNIAGYVGSDTVGVILATKIHELPGNWLAVDVGTNGEIALSSGGRLLTCSTAAGPAFEGACISQGMRAEPGAIYKVDIKNDVLLAVIGDAEPVGICGSGLIDAVSELVRLGIVRKNGWIKKPSDCPPDLPPELVKRIRSSDKGFKFVLAEGEQEVAVTQKDISELQLGKGAIRAGIEVLLNELNLKAEALDGILLAGAFGSNLNPESVKGIGMLPDVELSSIKSVGNAAGAGAVSTLLAKKQLELAIDLPKRVEHIELSLHQGFQRKFARSISF